MIEKELQKEINFLLKINKNVGLGRITWFYKYG